MNLIVVSTLATYKNTFKKLLNVDLTNKGNINKTRREQTLIVTEHTVTTRSIGITDSQSTSPFSPLTQTTAANYRSERR